MYHRLIPILMIFTMSLQSFGSCDPVVVFRNLIREFKSSYKPNKTEALNSTIQTMCANVYGQQKCLDNPQLVNLIEQQFHQVYRDNEVYAVMDPKYMLETTRGAEIKIAGRMERRVITYYDDKFRAEMVTGVAEAADGSKVLTQYGQPVKSNRSFIYTLARNPKTGRKEFIIDVENQGVTQHSSMNQGRPVLGAGKIETCTGSPGRIQTINIDSGHYKPNAVNLMQTLQHLQSEGLIDMGNMTRGTDSNGRLQFSFPC